MAAGRTAGQDRFANIASGEVTMSAANTITFTEILTGISLGVGVGILIDEIDYYPSSAALRELVGNADSIAMGWTTSNAVSDLVDAADRRVIHSINLVASIVGAVVSLHVLKVPFVHQFFPPTIFASPRIYLGTNTGGFGAAALVRSRLYYRFIELNAQEYLEIAETFQLTS